MDKSGEIKLFNQVYGHYTDWDVAKSESPDFICSKNGVPMLGVEVTELYSNESSARLQKIDGYTLELLDGGSFRHKDDNKSMTVDKVEYLKEGQTMGRKIDAIIQELPTLRERISSLSEHIYAKDARAESYLQNCPEVDLVIGDSSNMFWFDNFEDFFLPFYQDSNKEVIINSRFREIFLITSTRNSTTVRVPLKLNLFAADAVVLEELTLKAIGSQKPRNENIDLPMLFYCLRLSGYNNIGYTAVDNCLGIIVGGHLYLYTRDGKVIRDYLSIPEQLPKEYPLCKITDEMGNVDVQLCERLCEEMSKFRCCVPIYSKIELSSSALQSDKSSPHCR